VLPLYCYTELKLPGSCPIWLISRIRVTDFLHLFAAVHSDAVALRDARQLEHRGRDALARLSSPHPDAAPLAWTETHHQAAWCQS